VNRPCPDCLALGHLVPTSRADGRCSLHPRQAPRPRGPHDDPRHRALRAKVLHAWVGANGWVCPGFGVPSHPARDLQLDHVLAVSEGGAPFDEGNAAVLCKTCNTRKGGANHRRARPLPTGGTHTREGDGRSASLGVSRTRLSFGRNSTASTDGR